MHMVENKRSSDLFDTHTRVPHESASLSTISQLPNASVCALGRCASTQGAEGTTCSLYRVPHCMVLHREATQTSPRKEDGVLLLDGFARIAAVE